MARRTVRRRRRTAAQAEIDAHELTPHNTDTVARSTAVNARQIGEAAQATADAVRTELATHETTPHGGGGGTDQMARAAAAAAQAEIDAHEGSTHNHDATARAAAATAQGTADTAQAEIDAHKGTAHNTDGTARTAASSAQARADDAFALADEKVDASGAAAAALEVTSNWAEEGNPDPIPAPKLVNVVNAHEDIVNVLDGRLPRIAGRHAARLVAACGLSRGRFRQAVAAYRRQHCRHERWPGRAAVPARSRF